MVVTASVPESGFWALTGGSSQLIETSFRLTAHYQHMVGDKPGSNIALATANERVFCPIGGVFPPCDYRAVGLIVSASSAIETSYRPSYQRLVLDVGMLLSVDRRIGSFGGRSSDKPMVESGEWMAAIGRVFCWPGEAPAPEDPITRCRPMQSSVVDLKPDSATFGSLIPWQMGTCPPQDPDVVGFPICFVSFEVASDS